MSPRSSDAISPIAKINCMFSCCSASFKPACGGNLSAQRCPSSTGALALHEAPDGGIGNRLDHLRLWHAGPRAFHGRSLGARFYPVVYLLTRMRETRDRSTGLSLKSNLLDKMSRLEVHSIVPKVQLYARNVTRRRQRLANV